MRTSIIRWSIALLLLALVTRNLLAQPVPPRPPGYWEAYPVPSSQPTTDPYPGPATPRPYPSPEPYPWPTIPTRTPWPIIPTRTPTELTLSEKDVPHLFLDSENRHRESVVAAPTRDPEWEAEFYAVHSQRPKAQDVADRQWSLGFLAQTGRPPTEAEWVAHYYER